MAARYRIDYFEVILETTCGVCGYSFVAFPDIDQSDYKCPKCDQLYRVDFQIAPVSKVDLIKKNIKTHMIPNPKFDSEE